MQPAKKRQKLWPGPAAQASALVACPVCCKQVPLPLINSHLDTGCQSSSRSVQSSPGKPAGSPGLRQQAPSTDAGQPAEACEAGFRARPPPGSSLQQPTSASPPAAGPSGESVDLDGFRLTLFHQRREAGCAAIKASGPAAPEQAPADEGSDEQAQHDQHMRTLQEATSRQTLLRRLSAGGHAALQGHHTVPNFVSPAEEAALVALLDSGQPPWKDSTFNGRHRGKAWGVRMDLKLRKVLPAAVPLPALLQDLAERMRADVPALRNFHPTESNAIDYHRSKGHTLGPHVDDRQMSTGEIVTLSLLGRCTMTFATDGKKGSSQSTRVHLPPRTLQVLTGKARYSFTHAILKGDFEDERRVSITFRQSPVTAAG